MGGKEKMKKKTAKSYEIDMCNGPIFGKLVLFAVPLILSGLLQLLFNAADIVVVGRFAGKESMAAVGSTTSLINLMVNYYGAKKFEDLQETVHTSVILAVGGGLLLIFAGETFASPLLTMMGTPDDVKPLSDLYLQIYFLGMPGTLLYNFGSAILRAAGDTRRPLYFLLTAGVINAVLNLIFVIGFQMGVAGVATALFSVWFARKLRIA